MTSRTTRATAARLSMVPGATISEVPDNADLESVSTPSVRGTPDLHVPLETPVMATSAHSRHDSPIGGQPGQPDLAAAFIGLTDYLMNKDNRTPRVTTAKARDPDVFHGTDSSKLRYFLLQCNLRFTDRPDEFPNDKSKVIFALSHLRGTALSWFEPALDKLPDVEPDWLDDYDSFVDQLRINFGPHNVTRDAERSILTLKMKDNQRMTDYLVQFNHLASTMDSTESTKCMLFYHGLPARLKDEFSHGDEPPTTILELQRRAQRMDARYWDRRTEASKESKPEGSGKSKDKNANNSDSNNNGNNNNSGKKKKKDKKNSSSNNATSSTSGTSAKAKEDLTGKLGTDGKLTAAEKQRRRDKNLCLWCGEAGHMADKCPLNTKPKARAAKADSATPTAEAKNT